MSQRDPSPQGPAHVVAARQKQLDEGWAHFFEATSDLLICADPAGVFLDLSPSWERTLGFTLDELRAHPLAIGRRTAPYVDRDVEDAPPDAAHQLVLPARGRLEMQPAQREGGGGERVIVLHKGAADAECLEGGHRIDFGEPAAGIAEPAGTDELDGGHGGMA